VLDATRPALTITPRRRVQAELGIIFVRARPVDPRRVEDRDQEIAAGSTR